MAAINEVVAMLAAKRVEFGVAPADDDDHDGRAAGSVAGVSEVSVELLPSVLAWAHGASFEKAWLLSPSTFEGTLVRSLRQLDELLKQSAEAADALGDAALKERFEAGSKAVHRGIAFSSSLYF